MSQPEIEAWVEALRADLPDERDRDRVRARLLGAGVLVPAALAAPHASAASATSGTTLASAGTHTGLSAKFFALSWTGKLAVTALGLTLGGAPMLLPMLLDDRPPAPASIVRVPLAPAPGHDARGEAVPSAAPVTNGDREPAPVSSPTYRAQNEQPSALYEEARLLGEALRALQRGDRRAARDWLDRYGRRFPSGTLAPERARLSRRVRDGAPTTNTQVQGERDD